MKRIDTFFYTEPSNIIDDIVEFNKEELEHITKVLRLKGGEIITVVDGVGNAYDVEFKIERKFKYYGKIIKKIELNNETKNNITLGLALIRPAHIETAIDMAIQLGIKSIWFFKGDHTSSEWDNDRIEKFIQRTKRIAISSMKQCKRAYLPEISYSNTIDDLLKFHNKYDKIYFAYHFGLPIFENNNISNANYLLIVGPEGDFSSRELEFLKDISAIPISLGPRRLRTETAVVAFLTKALFYYKEI